MMPAHSKQPTHRTAIIADINGNSPALETVAENIEACGCRATYVLGDIINGVDPAGSLALSRGLLSPHCVNGTPELYFVTPDIEHIEGLYGDPTITETAQVLLRWRERISPADLTEVLSMPATLRVGGRCYIHDTRQDRFCLGQWEVPGVSEAHQEIHHHSRGLHSDGSETVSCKAFRLMQERSISELYCGHTHEAFVRRAGPRLICNPGSVGMPLDSDWRASWVVVERPGHAPDAGPSDALERTRLTIHRVEYDIDRTFHMLDEVADSLPSVDTAENLLRCRRRLETGSFH
jgi:diadenosine tetraphosphatase ApaH/serine/threonine PP2A family protein phosphatase